jgi:hypothetical protein
MKSNLFRLAFCSVLFLFFYFSCGGGGLPLQDSGSQTNQAASSGANRTASVSWACDGSKYFVGGALVVQDEYCEWNRASTEIGKPLECRFTSNFYTNLGPALTARRSSLPNTQFNSWTCLTGDADGNGSAVGCGRGSGIVPECIAGIPCEKGTCVPTRASDPAICTALNRLNRVGVDVVIPKWGEHPMTLRPSKGLERNCTVNSTGTIVQCNFQASPYRTCDQVSKEIEVTVKLDLTR